MCHLCAILNGIAGIIVFSAPSAVSSAWFPPSERTTATGIAIVFNNLGNAFSFLAGPAFVSDPSAPNSTYHDSNRFVGVSSNHTDDDDDDDDDCPDVDASEKALIARQMSYLMYTVAGLVVMVTVAIFVHFPSKPKLPPSITSSMERMDFLQGLKTICM
jgi:FLVCR family MFS transporter